MDTHNTSLLDATDRGAWMQTYTGRQFFPADPRPEEVFLGDIAHALSNICRYGGHVSHHYSVAQHSVLLSHYAEAEGQPREVQRLALMHDAAEAYVGDHIVALKASFPILREIEAEVWSAVKYRYHLSGHHIDVRWVSDADKRICVNEKAAFMPGEHSWKIDRLEALPIPKIYSLSAWEAEQNFLERADELGIKEIG